MLARATGLASVYRGTTTNSYGDVVDDNSTPAVTGVPVSVLEQTRSVSGDSDSTPRTVRYATGRAGADTGITVDDRLLYAPTGRWFRVTSVRTVANAVRTADLVFDLTAVDPS